MPQETRVVQCFQCEMFQMDLVKKSNKWQCKICQAKQTLRKVIFCGSANECKQKVQVLNREKGERESENSNAILDHLMENDNIFDENVEVENVSLPESNYIEERKKENKWKSFLDSESKKERSSTVRKQALNIVHEPFEITKRSKWNDYL